MLFLLTLNITYYTKHGHIKLKHIKICLCYTGVVVHLKSFECDLTSKRIFLDVLLSELFIYFTNDKMIYMNFNVIYGQQYYISFYI